ncbi:MAG: hypothetical protein M5U26_18020 [Planctomycetota bacterium]|nr:hypothetical protein [Planctomycetota bacterium]
MNFRVLKNSLSAAALMGLLCASASACDTPVFRYALERWEADFFVALVVSRGPLTEPEDALAERLRARDDPEAQLPNLVTYFFDLNRPRDERLEEMEKWVRHPLGDLAKVEPGKPILMLLYPQLPNLPALAWSGALNEAHVQALLDSPARRETARRLVKGDAVVWLLVGCGDEAADRELDARLTGLLRKMEAEFEAARTQQAEAEDDDPDAARPAADLKLKMSTLRVSREGTGEQVLMRMLLEPYPALAERKVPLIFPIFGRGRALDPLIPDDIEEHTVRHVTSFLAGPCSCEVKEQNPGFDLLVACNWDDLLGGRYVVDKALPPLTGLSLPAEALHPAAPAADAPAEPAAANPLPGAASPPADLAAPALWLGLSAVVLLLILVALAGGILVRSRQG